MFALKSAQGFQLITQQFHERLGNLSERKEKNDVSCSGSILLLSTQENYFKKLMYIVKRTIFVNKKI